MPKTSSVSVDAKSNTVIVSVLSSFYPAEAIDMAADRFSGICDTVFEEDHGRITIRLTPKGTATEELGYEFLNHTLASIKELGGA